LGPSLTQVTVSPGAIVRLAGANEKSRIVTEPDLARPPAVVAPVAGAGWVVACVVVVAGVVVVAAGVVAEVVVVAGGGSCAGNAGGRARPAPSARIAKVPLAASRPRELTSAGYTAAARRWIGRSRAALRASGREPLAVGPDLAQDPLQARLARGVHVRHRRRGRGVDGGDALVHRLGDGAVGGMSLAAGAKLADVHCLAGVQVEDVADPVAEAEGVRRRLGQAGALEALELAPRDLERALVLAAGAGLAHLLRDARAEVGAELLPLAGEQPVALKVAEAAVVGDDLEAVAHGLPAAAGSVPPVAALAGELRDQLGALE